MIILRQREFRRDEIPSYKRFVRDPEVEKDLGVELKIVLVPSKKYNIQSQTPLYKAYKSEISKLRQDIKSGYLYDDGPNGGDTHYLSDYSRKRDSALMSKIIGNTEHRLNYRVYEPEIIIGDDGNPDYIQKVVLESCLWHDTNGAGTY